MKNAAVRIAGFTREPQNLIIQPGTTAAEILNQLGLEGYLLSAKGANTYFGDDETIYSQIVDGDLLYATTAAEVGVI
jgi:hypothetical protein